MKYLILILIVALSSCSKYNDIHYSIINITFEGADNSAQTPVVTGKNTFPKNAFAIKATYYFRVENYKDSRADPYESKYINTNSIDSFDIITLQPYDTISSHHSILSYFLISKGDEYYASNTVKNTGFGYMANTTKLDSIANNYNYFILMKSPQKAGNYSFDIITKMHSGIFLHDTLQVTLN